jgi:hypothetical protein
MKRVIITQPIFGICYMQVCAEADASDEEILEVCNSENPSGTTNGWAEVIRTVEEEHNYRIPNFQPVQCSEYSDRQHFLIVC